ncbi:hypothetical protein V6N11_015209 [Hibiscus sabdariffa]|uniref:Protein kinase domain-containing protein n=1 Tax=Hibiscus sabdariffa TaxID=183260 RepID=A0ABR2TRV9_9ROSI
MRVLVLFSFVIFTATLSSSGSFALTDNGLTLLEMKSTLSDSGNYLGNCNLPYMQLGGKISPSIGKLNRLQRLYLRANYLEGGIPSNFGSLFLLTALDLSSNLLKGAIPSSIGRLTRLRYLNLSTNFFSGEIPAIGVLNTFGNKSFIGNSDLCGQQIHKPCRTSLGFPAVLPHAETKRSSRYIKGVLIGAMSTLAVMLVVLLTFLWICLLSKKDRDAKRYTEVKKQVHQDMSAKLITFHGDLPYPSCEIIEKLESLDEEDVVGSGGFGTVYRMVMNDCGTFAVKRIDRNREGSDEVFEREVEILGSIKYINLVNLRGYCRLPASKLLIYDYLAMGSLDDFLHESKEARPLNWCTRLKIALGSARDVVDRRCNDTDMEALEAILEVAAKCTDANPDERPTMNQVVQLLEQEVMSPCPSDFYDSHSEYC